MTASHHVGRVGRLAVALGVGLGVGAAVFTGHGIAAAQTDSGSSPGSPGPTSESSGSTGTSPDPDAGGSTDVADPDDGSAAGSQGSQIEDTVTEARVGGGGPAGALSRALARLTDGGALGRTDDAQRSLESIVEALAESVGSAITDRAAGSRDGSDDTESPRSNRSVSDRTGDEPDPATAFTPAVERVTAPEPIPNAGTVADGPTPAPVTTLAAAPIVQALPTAAVAGGTESEAGALPSPPDPTRVSSLITGVVSNVLGPLAGDNPAGPVDSPLAWALLAFARRDFSLDLDGIASTFSADPVAALVDPDAFATPQLTGPGLFDNPIVVTDPTIEFEDALIFGDINATDSNGGQLNYTVISQPDQGGKVFIDTDNVTLNGAPFNYLPDLAVVDSQGSESFEVLINSTTGFVTALESLPLIGGFVPGVLTQVYQIPVISDLLAPLIGYSVVQEVTVDISTLGIAAGTPVAFTTKVVSFDGTLISTNFFPALDPSGNVLDPDDAPTVLNGPGLASAGNIDPNSTFTIAGLVPGISQVREAGYNYVSWDPRGEFDSGGVLQLDNPFFEGRDVIAIIDFLEDNDLTETDGSGDPLLGMIGGSYGGGIQWVVAGIDPRIDAIVPGISWNSLELALYPREAFKFGWANLLLLALVTTGADINTQIYTAVATGDLFGFISQSAQATLASSGPTVLVDEIDTPALVIQGTIDDLFVLEQSVINASTLDENGVPVKLVWYCGGHGVCLDRINPDQTDVIFDDTFTFLDQHVLGVTPPPADEIPNFRFFDQDGDQFISDLFPFSAGFIDGEVTATGDGGVLPIVPVIGGSGPQTAVNQNTGEAVPLLEGIALGADAQNAINLTIEPDLADEVYIVGQPELTFTYSGIGLTRHVYAQIVDEQTGRVVGNLVTPIPVTLDGQTRTATFDMENIVYTMEPGDKLRLQITSSATAYENFTSYGVMNISDVSISLPTADTDFVTQVV